MAVRDFDPGAVTLTWGPYIITGFAAGTYITWEADADSFTKVVGAQGDTTRIRSRNRASAVTFTLLQTSLSNDVLSTAHLLDTRGVPQKWPVTIRDNLGTTKVFAEQGWIKRWAGVSLSEGDEGREWVLDMGETLPNVGGSVT